MDKEKMKKYIPLFVASLIIVILAVIVFKNIQAKTDTTLVKYYEAMQMDKIDSYTLDLRVYGKEINNNVRIDNYKGEQMRISIMNPEFDLENPASLREIEYLIDKGTVYQEGEITEENPVSTYAKVNDEVVYKNTDIFLEGLTKVSEVSDAYNKSLGIIDYVAYDVTFKEEAVGAILKELKLDNIKVEGDIEGQVYLKDDYVYRVVYELDNLTINATYFGINTGRLIRLPEQLN